MQIRSKGKQAAVTVEVFAKKLFIYHNLKQLRIFKTISRYRSKNHINVNQDFRFWWFMFLSILKLKLGPSTTVLTPDGGKSIKSNSLSKPIREP